MQAVILHPLRLDSHLLHKERQQGDLELLGKPRIDRAECLSIAAAVVRRYPNLHQQRAGVRLLRQGDDLLKVALQIRRRKTAQSVIGAELNQHPARPMLLQQRRQARQPLGGGVAADAGVDHFGAAGLFLPLFGQPRRPGLRHRQTVAGAETVAKNQ